MLKRLALALLLMGNIGTACAACADMWDWVEMGCRTIVDTYKRGDDQLLLSGYAWHLPWTWTAERRAQENSQAWGAGWARTVERPNGDTDSVYFLVFEDSHKDAEFNLGYAWMTYWRDRENVQPGLGYTVFILQRPDIANGVPVPAILPMFGMRYQKFTLLSTFIPTLNGGVNHGSVLYLFASIGLGGK
jgi:lipid IVA palmitoyltransferase